MATGAGHKIIIILSVIQTISGFHFYGEDEDAVTISQHVPEGGRQRRSTDGFPLELDISLAVADVRVELALIHSIVQSDHVPVYVNRGGRVVRHRIPNAIVKNDTAAFYYERNNGSSFMVWPSQQQGDEEERYALFGIFSLGPREYQVQPLDRALATHTLSLIPDAGPRITDYIKDNNKQVPSREAGSRADRVKRQTEDVAYEAETAFVVDYAVYSFWDSQVESGLADRANVLLNTIKQFYAFVLNTINVRYASVTGSGYTLTCLYAGIYIAETASAAPFIENNLLAEDGAWRRKADADVVLPAFRDWVATDLTSSDGYMFDHAFLFTGYDIGTFENGEFKESVAGYAYVGDVCDANRVSINEDNFTSNIGTVAAHEFGHNMNSQHDGTDNLCNGTDGYVMAASSGTTFDDYEFNRRKFFFSSCSIAYFTGMIDTLNAEGNNCLANRSTSYDPDALIDFSDDLAGQVYPPDQQCAYIMGTGSYLNRRYYTNYEDICGVMNCSYGGFTYALTAWEGTSCANGKVCVKGSCVMSSTAPTNLSEGCLFGDTPYTSDTCEEVMGAANTSYNCYSATNQQQCCKTCQVHRQNNAHRTNCEYGDQSSGCATLSLAGCYANEDLCCQSCPDRALDDPNCRYGDQSSACSTLSRINCYAGTNDDICCARCAAFASNNPDCLYGDKLSGCAVDDCPNYTEESLDLCCETCATSTTTPPTTTATTPPTTTTTTTPTTTTTMPPTTTTTTTTTTPPSTTTITTLTTTTTTPTTTETSAPPLTTTTTPPTTTTTTPPTTTTTTVVETMSPTTTTSTTPPSTTTTTTTPTTETTTTATITTPSTTTTTTYPTTTTTTPSTTTTTTPPSTTTSIFSTATTIMSSRTTTTTPLLTTTIMPSTSTTTTYHTTTTTTPTTTTTTMYPSTTTTTLPTATSLIPSTTTTTTLLTTTTTTSPTTTSTMSSLTASTTITTASTTTTTKKSDASMCGCDKHVMAFILVVTMLNYISYMLSL